ncbi:p23 chaperone protein wos2, partial [Dispira simplex]
MATTTFHPEVLWAQRTNEIYLTINLPDATITTLDIQPTTVKFEGVSKDKKYAFELELHAAVNPETSKKANTARSIFL